MLRGNLWKTQGKHRCCVGSNWKRTENYGFDVEAIENITKTHVFNGNLLKTQGKHKFCVGSYCKRKANTGFALEPIENTKNTQVLRGNLWRDAVTPRDASRSGDQKHMIVWSHLLITIVFVCWVFSFLIKVFGFICFVVICSFVFSSIFNVFW